MSTEKWRLLLLVGCIRRKLVLYFSVGTMFRMLMCICELMGEFEFDGLSPKPPNKNHRQYFHVYTISFIVCLSGLYQTLGLSVGCL